MPTDVPVIPPFNPLDKRNLGESVAEAMLLQPVSSLPPSPFIGAGIYALYYTGTFPPYEVLASRNRGNQFHWPIYVGKAVPAGARKGGFGLGEDPGQVMFRRLCEHGKSIEQAINLSLADFRCRFLVVEDIWIPLAESLLVTMFHPVWNRRIDGFGNHDPGTGRALQQCSHWDVLHPGRAWATKLPRPQIDEKMLHQQVVDFIANADKQVRIYR